MADEPIVATETTAAEAAPPPASEAAPAAGTPPAEPSAAAPHAAEPEPAAAETKTEAEGAETATEAEAEPTSLLGEAAKPGTEAPKEPEAPATPEVPETPAEAPAAPVYEFQWPDGTEPVAAEVLQPFTGLLGEAKVAPEIGQKLLDLHIGEQQKLIQNLERQQEATWRETRQGWVDQVRSDPDLGGNRLQATVQVCGQLIEQFGGTPEQKAELRQVLNLTGAGDHPALVRFIHNVGMALSEGNRAVPGTKPVPVQTRRADRRYAGSMNGAA